jgi:UDP-glucose 4-epimerase
MVGAYVARELRRRGDVVVLFDKMPDGAAVRAVAGDVPLERGDVVSREDLLRVIDTHGVEAIIHTAAILPGPGAEPKELVQVNVGGTLNVLEVAGGRKIRMVHVSSSVVYYGAFASAPPGAVTEDAPLAGIPGFFYGTTKLAADRLAFDYAVTGLADVVICRLGHVWGFWPGPPRSPIAVLLAIVVPRLLAGETAVVEDARLHWKGREAFVHVENAAAGLAAAVHVERVAERVLNLVDDRPFAFGDLVAALERCVPGARVERREQPMGGYAGVPAPPPGPLSIERARAALGYAPARDLDDGVHDLVNAFRSGAPRR